jgi:hypothetical protein
MRISIIGSRLCALCVLVAAMLPLAGCGSKGTAVPQFQVRGKVLSQGGEPAAGAIVVLHPVSKTNGASPYPPRGVADKDGAFVVGSRMTGDGAPEGDYAVTLVWPAEQDAKKQFDDKTPPDRLKNRYNDVKNAKWNIHVAAGTNTLEAFTVE